MSDAEREKWNARYRTAEPDQNPEAAAVLRENTHLLPRTGSALDLACGLGGNALLLARLGLETHGWDLADEALHRLRVRAEDEGLQIAVARRDVAAEPPAPENFDVIVVSRFLVRELCPSLARALRPGGLIFYQTFVRDSAGDVGPRRPEFRLAENELLHLFADLRLRVYREEGTVGDPVRGWRNEAMLVAQAPGVARRPGRG